MHVLHVDNVVTSIVKWIDPSLKDLSNVNSSYALCNNVYHTVNVRRRNRVLELRLDRDSVVSTNITENVFIATVHIGGVPGKILFHIVMIIFTFFFRYFCGRI